MRKQFKAAQIAAATLCMLLLSFSSSAEPPNLARLTEEITTYHDSGTYDKELDDIILEAKSYILQAAANNKQSADPKKLAIVLDIDETSISNYNKMVKRHFIGLSEQIHREILEANSPAIPATLALYKAVTKAGVKVFFVTGRHLSETKATRLNLLRAGFDNWEGLYLRPDDYPFPSIIPFKSSTRERITQDGYWIVASIGDQCSDLVGGFAEKGFKLPNPFYYLP
ncbi:MAG: acid phosphatase [Legionella sp.]|nr:acid phosphatase [Legionella sp.]